MLKDFSNILKPGSGYGTGISNNFTGIGSFISQLLTVVFYLAVFIAFFWLVWGAFQYMVATGDKERLSQARKRITWAIIGLIFVFAAFLVAQFAEQILNPRFGTPII